MNLSQWNSMQFSDLAVVFPLERKKRFYYDLIYESTDILPLKGLCLCGPLFKNKYKKGAALKWQRLFTRPPAEHGDQEDGGRRHNDCLQYNISGRRFDTVPGWSKT